MGIDPDYVFILPAVIVVGWILSWWGSRRVRWALLSVAAIVSVLCIVIGWQAIGPPIDPRTVGCSPALECMDARPFYLIAAGLLGIACCVALSVMALVGELVIRSRKGATS